MGRHNQRIQISEAIDRLATIVTRDEIDKALTEVKADIEVLKLKIEYGNRFKEPDAKLDRQGEPWTNAEECKLMKEMDVAMEYIGERHGRTAGAIKARLEHMRE
jgi:hypothetical protein